MTKKHGSDLVGMTLATVGVVFGDIGTSPLYALNETKNSLGGKLSTENVFGMLSLFFWALAIIVTMKYIYLVMRADNKGEGGIFALLALLKNGNGNNSSDKTVIPKRSSKWVKVILPSLIVLGACLLYADGMITPAISVLSAWEGLEVSSKAFHPYIIPLTYLTLFGLFAIQRWGTDRVGNLFKPVMVVWFLVIGGLGLVQITKHPEIIQAVNPWYAIQFCVNHGSHTWIILGSVVLCITGGEALYADMGHFGAKPIRTAWFAVVYPSLLLNYFGQGAHLLSATADNGNNLFYAIVPKDLLIPMVILATAATVIASQALISGAFSLTRQAISLGLFPRLKIKHTNADHEGQIYIPFINWTLFIGCILLVQKFETSSALAAAYGIAVTGTMAITTIAFMQVAIDRMNWKPKVAVPICILFASVDLAFFGANTLKFWNGGYVPILIAICLFTLMYVWQWGRENLMLKAFTSSYSTSTRPRFTVQMAADLIGSKKSVGNHQLFLTSNPVRRLEDLVPLTLQLHIERHGKVPEAITFVTVLRSNNPSYYHTEKVILYQKDGCVIKSIITNFGYMREPEMGKEVEAQFIHRDGDLVVGEEFFINEAKNPFFRLAARLFSLILKISAPAYMYFGLGPQVKRLVKEIIPIHIGKKGDVRISP
ncbi:MAG TPA: KUP/HAK/KT family potassium transporter [Candidatus Udaeobacter sp.]|nr:KUP/HAK/KT family potassium transporter [Candidatus Udaeobacter sp.]